MNNWSTLFPAQRSGGDLFPEVSSLAGAGDVQNSRGGCPQENSPSQGAQHGWGGVTPWLGVGRHTAVRYYIALAFTSSQKYGTV